MIETLIDILALAVAVPLTIYILWIVLIAVVIPFLRIK